ncbi:MAG: preprotein translocase subunit SecA [Clostridia bacterium]|nr:preprotein translocase subunit SecA [Clostridia bacterium]
MGLFDKIFGTYSDREIKRIEPIMNKVLELEESFSSKSEAEMRGMTAILKQRYQDGETLDNLLPEAFATVREAAWRVLDMKHYPVQIIGGIVLHQGRIAEMKTGEGKTLMATLPVYLNALSGNGVHVVTVNDYLAKRDSEWMGKIYRYLGMSVGLIVHDMDKAERRKAYASDITYGTNNEYGFDYLRDNMVNFKEQMVQRPLNYAIVDEVDSILIDEARTPLIISGMGGDSSEMYGRADAFVRTLRAFVIAEMDDKEEADSVAGDSDYIVDEKAKTAVLTQHGIQRAERYFHIDNLSDENNFELQHYINNALKAHGTMHLDEQYIVKDGEVVIVDDFTGRLMIGRRYSDGLHQAIEAKEGVKVEHESKTLATITFQNYFRMYKKLSGMTGTALTEEEEFRSIYRLDVIVVPTNKPMIRMDEPDAVYKSEQGKLRAVVEEVKAANAKGQPVLIGTVSVDKSEKISSLFRKNGIKHNILNAKQHQREAEIVAQAGRFGSVTIATNMAGRGTDIILGGNSEYMARQAMREEGYDEDLIESSTAFNETSDTVILEAREKFHNLEKKYRLQTDAEKLKVVEAGGLYIVGTERHESRRIDNQLRGRSGRQGDIGKSKFYLSLDDDLMRQFGGDRMNNLFATLGVDDDMEIQHKMLSNAIESAQKKVEGRNFGIRKNVLEYDDVMNQQREVIYAQRREVLEGKDLRDIFEDYIRSTIEEIVRDFSHGWESSREWDTLGLKARLMDVTGELPIFATLSEMIEAGVDAAELIVDVQDQAISKYHGREAELGGPEIMHEAERVVMLRTVDNKWMDHIDAMDTLKNTIGMRSIAQHDPVVEYRREGFEMFTEMTSSIAEECAKLILRAQFVTNQPPKRQEAPQELEEKKEEASAMHAAQAEAQAKAKAQAQAQAQAKTAPARNVGPALPKPAQAHRPAERNIEPASRDKDKVGRNDPCPCGSGKKYKNCHGKA